MKEGRIRNVYVLFASPMVEWEQYGEKLKPENLGETQETRIFI